MNLITNQITRIAGSDPPCAGLTYLKLKQCPVGLLLNFNVPVLKDGIVRIVNPSLVHSIEPIDQGAGNDRSSRSSPPSLVFSFFTLVVLDSSFYVSVIS